jgi:hypothetical protein
MLDWDVAFLALVGLVDHDIGDAPTCWASPRLRPDPLPSRRQES